MAKLSCTVMKYMWLLPTFVKEVPHAKVRDINFAFAGKLKAGFDAKLRVSEKKEKDV